MTPNDEYRDLYHDRGDAPRAAREAARNTAQDEWDAAIKAELKRRKLKKKDKLPDDYLESLRTELTAKHDLDGHDAWIEAEDKAREDRLETLAGSVEFIPDPGAWYRVKTAATASYRTQGYGAEKYARGDLAPLQEKLTSLGLHTHVRQTRARYSDWELWADCPEWMADAASRLITFAEWVACHKRAARNIRVYNPFIPWEVA